MVAVARSLVRGQLLGHNTGVVLVCPVEVDQRGERMLVPGHVLPEIQCLGEVADVETHRPGEGPPTY
jgi:hypothetical protein